MKKIIVLILLLISNYCVSQVSFSLENIEGVKLEIKNILKEKNNLDVESIYIQNLISKVVFNCKSDSGVYEVFTNYLHFGNYILIKKDSNYSFFFRVPILEVFLKEIQEIENISSRLKKRYLRGVYYYYLDYLDTKSQNELVIIPKDRANNVGFYLNKKKRKYSIKKKEAKKKYNQYKKEVNHRFH